MDELPYQAEYAKSGRAACRGCKEKIGQGELRLAVMVQSAFHDSKQPNWHHEQCFFKRLRPKSVAEIGKYNTLKSADQKRVANAIGNYTGIVMPVEKGKKGKGKGTKRANGDSNQADLAAVRDFLVEYSKSSRATCRVCEIKITKDEVRISKTVFDTEIGQKYGGQPLWHHVKCFAEDRLNLLYMAGGEDLPGFKILSKEDQAMVKKEIKSLKPDEIPIKKLKEEPKDSEEVKQEKAQEKALQRQSNLFDKYREALRDLPRGALQKLLENNGQQPPAGKEDCLIMAADMLAFGALEPCAECGQGQLVLDTHGYRCTGDKSEWTKCTAVCRAPPRRAARPPADVPLPRARCKVQERLFPPAPPPVFIVKKEDAEVAVKKERPNPPLKNLQFYLYGRLGDKEAVKRRILKMGGLVTSAPVETLAAVVSTRKDLERMPAKMAEIQEMDLEVVEQSFLDLIEPTGTVAEALALIRQHNIADWGSDPAKRVPQDVLDGKSVPRSGSNYAKSAAKSKVLKLKGGTAVEPESGLEHSAHVLRGDAGPYCAVLGRTDVAANKNSYYKLQVLEADDKKKYWMFRSWGRIGTTIGSTKLESFGGGMMAAVAAFEAAYLEKTDNPWECRDMFIKMPGKYYPIETDYGDAAAEARLALDPGCALPPPVQELMLQIFDVEKMKRTLLEFELDTEKMPLGKLSKRQMKAGYAVLSRLLALLEAGTASAAAVCDATNEFYTLIPHSFGTGAPPLLDSAELLRRKSDMLDNMMEIEIAYSLLSADTDASKSPIEAHYLKLNAEITPLASDSEEYALLRRCVANTHAATHAQYTLEIEHIFKVSRSGEERRYKPFRRLHNRRLLWHGSRVTNFVGILSQGLRIAPPEAPVTGYMFGKGIYFADMVSKSANYCCASRAAPRGVLLLCEVALGDMKRCTRAETVVKLPPGTHSVWGAGRTQPAPAAAVQLGGAELAVGAPVAAAADSTLLYNEFIVYDVAQVNVKYLFQVKFNFK